MKQFDTQVSVTHQFQPRAKQVNFAGFGKYSVDFVNCLGSDMCYPYVIVLSKGFLVQAGESLKGVPLSSVLKTYVPEMRLWLKDLLAKA